MRLTDEEWLAKARAAAANGSYEPISPVLSANEPAPAVAASPRCACCTERPPLEVYPRREVVTERPLYYCPRCYGFWALAGTLDHGVRDPYDDHPAFRVAPAPPRCRDCFGAVEPNGVCAKCGNARLVLCPGCEQPMSSFENAGVELDQCGGCRGVWFDMGELARVYGLQSVQGFAASTIGEPAAEDEPSAWQLIAETALALFFRFGL